MLISYFLSSVNDDEKKAIIDVILETSSIQIRNKLQLKDIKQNSIAIISKSFPDRENALRILEEKNCYVINYIKDHLESPIVIGKTCIIGEDITHYNLLKAIAALKIRKTEEKNSAPAFYFGNTKIMLRLKEDADKAQRGFISVHISGEIGSGKSLLARYIAGDRKLVSLNCSCLDQSLVLDTLFGHNEGAYTGANKERLGLCREANGAVLFLDEIQDLAPSIQAMLLDVIETGEMRPLGSDKKIKVKFKLITASSKNIAELRKVIRDDLFSRIGVIKLRVPPLRERKEDIPDLIKIKLRELKKQGTGYDVTFNKSFITYSWPGNIRELFQRIEYLYTMGEEKERKEKRTKTKIILDSEKEFETVPSPDKLIKLLNERYYKAENAL